MITSYYQKTFLCTLVMMGMASCSLWADDASSHETTSSIETASNKSSSVASAKAADEAQKLTALYAELRKQLDTLIASAQICAQFIITKAITPPSIPESLFWLQNFMEVARKAAQIPYVPITSYKLSRSIKLNTQLIAALREAQTSNFTSLADLEGLEHALKTIEKDIMSPKNTRVSLALLLATFNENQELLKELSKKIQGGGLTWYNKLYRGYIVLDQKLMITPIVKATAAVTALAALGFYLLPNSTMLPDGNIKHAKKSLEESFWYPYLFRFIDPQQDEYKRLDLLTRMIGAYGVLSQVGAFAKAKEFISDLDAYLIGATPITHHSLQYANIEFSLEDKMFDSVRHLLDPFYQILTFLKNPDLYIHSGQKVPKCVLLTGPPGSGKTHSARAFAGSIQKLYEEQGKPDKVGFIVVAPYESLEEKIREAKEHAPCVLFVDEFHLHNQGLQINNGIPLSLILREIDDIDKNDDPIRQIFIIGATNRPDLLAKALLRAGRFGPESRVNFSVPDYEQRTSVITALCQATFINLSRPEIEHIAKLTQDCAFSSINKVIERAARDAKALNTEARYEHVYAAFNSVIRGLHERIELPEDEKDIIATHLAGSAVAHLLLSSNTLLDAITLKIQAPKIIEGHDFLQKMENVDEDMQHKMQKYGALFTYNAHEHIHVVLKDLFVQAKLYLAGIVAQNVILGIESDYRIEERQKAYESIVAVLLRGLKQESLSKDAFNNLQTQSFSILENCEKELKELMLQNRESIIRIAQELKREAFLTADEIKSLITSQAIPEITA